MTASSPTGPRLFGTDGIRGKAGSFPLDPETVTRLGQAVAQVFVESRAGARGEIRALIGRDTRESGDGIEQALTRGLLEGGANVSSGGILPTPAVALLTLRDSFDLGIVISASHNPFDDNGIKIFSSRGYKLPERLELAIEERVLDRAGPFPAGAAPARPVLHSRNGSLQEHYLSSLLAALPAGFSLGGRRVILDCANGAASHIAPELFRRLGAEVVSLAAEPDGRNINRDCGALYPEGLAAEVRARGAFLGMAYDGDADRCILVDEQGTVRDGDDILAVAGTAFHRAGTLARSCIVSTVMANYGLERHLKGLGIELVRTPVGDKYVLAEMLDRGAVLGGEQSGHVIFLDCSTTGDGVLTSLKLAHLVVAAGKPLSELASFWTRMPQVLVNVRVRERKELNSIPEVKARVDDIEARLAGRGRLLLRYSGTEPLARIMIEGEDAQAVRADAEGLADVVRRALGAP